MSKPFLITGLPRSRTAWMAEFMSNGGCVCQHEPLAKLSDISQLRRVFNSYAGISDSGASLFLSWIMENINPHTVIIDRQIDEVEQSLSNIGFKDDGRLRLMRERLLEFKDHPSVMWVKYRSLDDDSVMRKVFWHLRPGVPFDEGRYNQMRKINIVTNVKSVIANSRKYRDSQLNLLRGSGLCLG